MANKENTSDRELVVTRNFNAPRELVFEAWVNPKHIIHWFGPDGFTNTFHEMNVKPGGVWRFTMHGPDGTNYPNKIIFTEVVKPERLVYTHNADRENDPNEFEVTVTFEALEKKKTLLTMKMVVKSADILKQMKKFGAVEGAIQTLNHLEEYLLKM